MATETVDLTKADAAYLQGKFTEADARYREAVAKDPANAAALEKLGNIALWKNDLAAAETYLKAAQKNQSWFNRRWPMNIPIKMHLALVYARADRMREAADLFESAAGLFPYGPLKEFKLKSAQLKLLADAAPYRVSGDAETIVPFIVTDPLPVIHVSINGSEPSNFFIDTGGEGLIVDAGFGRQIGAVTVGEVDLEYAGNKKGKTGFGKVDQVRIGGISVSNVPISTLDLDEISRTVFPGLNVKGIVGTGFLKRFLSTLDYKKGQLVLRQPFANKQKTDQAIRLTERDHVFPIWLVETHLIFTEGSVNQLPPGMMFIDTGLADGGFHASRAILTQAGVNMDWSQANYGVGGGGKAKSLGVTIDEVTLGRDPQAIHRKNIRGIVFEEDISIFNDALGFKVGGLISHQFFRDFAVTFDFENMRLILQ